MIATLNGKIEEQGVDSVVINVAGVGYFVYMPSSAISGLSVGSEAKTYIYEHIREQSHDLFGFSDKTDKDLFEKLLSVNGVGPKMALAILNIGHSGMVRNAIVSKNVKLLQSASGVGKKVAERIVVDLKDKVSSSISDDSDGFFNEVLVSDEAVQALVSLGYSQADAQKALNGIDKDLSIEERIKAALRNVVR